MLIAIVGTDEGECFAALFNEQKFGSMQGAQSELVEPFVHYTRLMERNRVTKADAVDLMSV